MSFLHVLLGSLNFALFLFVDIDTAFNLLPPYEGPNDVIFGK